MRWPPRQQWPPLPDGLGVGSLRLRGVPNFRRLKAHQALTTSFAFGNLRRLVASGRRFFRVLASLLPVIESVYTIRTLCSSSAFRLNVLMVHSWPSCRGILLAVCSVAQQFGCGCAVIVAGRMRPSMPHCGTWNGEMVEVKMGTGSEVECSAPSDSKRWEVCVSTLLEDIFGNRNRLMDRHETGLGLECGAGWFDLIDQ